MQIIDLDWSEFKTEIIAKGFPLNHRATNTGYEVFSLDRSLIWRAVINDSADVTDFETNYKANSNRCVYDDYGKQYTRAESRPIDMTTYFTSIGDDIAGQGIGTGKELSWDFSNDDDEIAPPDSMSKRKRLEFQFIDEIRVKEGAIYWKDKQAGSYIDLYVVCPAGGYYLSNGGEVRQAAEDTIIDHFVSHHMMMGDCTIGDELNTEAASLGIPNYMKFWIDVTVPASDSVSKGHVSLELYRPRTAILP